jgi:acyl-coenzyme A thioesterase PaaI-like protein
VANAFADSLDQLPPRPKPWEISEAGISPGDRVSFSPISGAGNPISPPVQMHLVEDAEGRHIEGSVTWGPAYEGPPGHCHGGWTAAMFDEVLGFAQVQGGFTGYLNVNYRAPTPLNRELTLRGWVDRVEGRKQFIRGTCHLDGKLLSDAEGLFISLREGVDFLTHLGLS